MRVVQNISLTKDIYQLDLTGDFPYEEAKPGQFVNVLIGRGKSHPLRRPLSIASVEASKRQLTLVYRVVGDGTEWLSTLEKQMPVDVLGPLGKGFPMPQQHGPLLIVGGGVGIPPLYELSKVLADRGCELDIVLGFRSGQDVFWLEEFSRLGSVTLCTDDGSLGEKGFVTTALQQFKNWTAFYACGPREVLKALAHHFAQSKIQGYFSLEENMACGIGACAGCTCLTKDGTATRRICKDGPVFAKEEVRL